MTGPINSDRYTELVQKAEAFDAIQEWRRSHCTLCADGIAFVDDRPPVLPAMHQPLGREVDDQARPCTATEAARIAQLEAGLKVATDALVNAKQALIDYEMVSDGDPTFGHRNLMEGIGTALSSEAVAVEFARQQARADVIEAARSVKLQYSKDGGEYPASVEATRHLQQQIAAMDGAR